MHKWIGHFEKGSKRALKKLEKKTRHFRYYLRGSMRVDRFPVPYKMLPRRNAADRRVQPPPPGGTRRYILLTKKYFTGKLPHLQCPMTLCRSSIFFHVIIFEYNICDTSMMGYSYDNYYSYFTVVLIRYRQRQSSFYLFFVILSLNKWLNITIEPRDYCCDLNPDLFFRRDLTNWLRY